ncbi:MAG: bifunctional diaminohydroxyphosphoribosylaminopyrimidine deaminase/5-amino-6-(5-phosphoribosylamino)uracil reductase RibD [Candidatus Eremiobacteraeota bacterium]|nr:bifunctional diaminohydroxyphosphoribosylaminopyrimidine deaminase/5-amino-6-(5-phosphoribosylamino)uracil reductase RibD [Candidatus Eremiobacteraeota bacterium]
MRLALKLAAKASGNTSPNPLVGAVVLAGDTIVGSGFHAQAGADHAEAVALREAGAAARGATLYVTLEPCAHQGRTPPCVDAIVAAAPARVVVAIEDPDERVRGQGIKRLRDAGITIDVGVEAAAAFELNRRYLHHRRTHLPFLTLKMAQSLDGKIAPQPGQQLQLTGKRALKLVRTLRFEHDAVMVGAGTIAVDDPQLTVRPAKKRAQPYLRIVADARGSVPLRARIFKEQSRARTIVLTTAQMPGTVREELQRREIKLLECAADSTGRVDLHDALRRLGEMDVVSVLCEGGPTLAASLLQQRLVNELQWLIAPSALGADAQAVLGMLPAQLGLRFDDVRRLGEDVAIRARCAEA